MSKNSTCSIESCNNSNYCRTWCRPHYRKWERTGDPNYDAAATRYKNLTEKVMSRIDKNDPNGCWIWIGYINEGGYGRVTAWGKPRLAHRLVYQIEIGTIPEGLVLDHLCRNRKCVNPKHLEPVTSGENTRRGNHKNCGIRKREQTHCIRGHEFNKENTYLRPDGRRLCRSCARMYDKERYPRRKLTRRMISQLNKARKLRGMNDRV